jgi:nucleoside 2-deoxyribosyltransferase
MRIYLAGDFFERHNDVRLEKPVLNKVLKEAGHCNVLVSYLYYKRSPQMQNLILFINKHNGDSDDTLSKKSKFRRKSS